MESSKRAQATRVCVWQLSLEAWTARKADHPANLAEDYLFAAYLRGQKTPQAYRYLRGHLARNWSEACLVSYDELAASLDEKTVLSSLKGKSLDEITEIVTQASNAKRDLDKAFAGYRKVMGNEKAPEQEASSSVPRAKRPVVRSAGKGPSQADASRKPQVLDGEGA